MRVKLPFKKNESSNSKMSYSQPKGTISLVFNDSSNVPNWRMLEVLVLSYFGLIIFQVHILI